MDPITLEVYRHRFAGVAEEMGITLQRTSYSPNIKERLDEGTLKLSHVTSREQIVDCLTKGLASKECSLACNKIVTKMSWGMITGEWLLGTGDLILFRESKSDSL
jgi:hypothetical protein